MIKVKQSPAAAAVEGWPAAFSFLDESYAATLTVVLLMILAVLAIGQYFLLEKRINYQ